MPPQTKRQMGMSHQQAGLLVGAPVSVIPLLLLWQLLMMHVPRPSCSAKLGQVLRPVPGVLWRV
jgi:hypothetical protein